MKTYGNVILMAIICIVIFWIFMALRPASAQCSYAMNDVGRFHGYVSGPCNGAAVGYNGAYPYHPNARAGAHPTVVAPKVVPQVNGHSIGACDAACQSKCQATWRAGGFKNVEACYAKWSRLNANPELARACEAANRANGWRHSPGC
jgi:hypothetical protein